MFDVSTKLNIPCTECKREVALTIREIEQNPSYVCPGCKKTIHLDASEFSKGLKEAEKKLKKLFR
jgi:DNA-directed RNA polymerase subunit RPC12/RpoP